MIDVYLPGDEPKGKPVSTFAPEIEELRLPGGRTVRLGQTYRDNRADNIRELRVCRVAPPDGRATELRLITCRVVAVTNGGETTAPERERVTSMTAHRLTSRAFVLAAEAPE